VNFVSHVFVIITTGIADDFPEMFSEKSDLDHGQVLKPLLAEDMENEKIVFNSLLVIILSCDCSRLLVNRICD
jgi:hypothetical protein